MPYKNITKKGLVDLTNKELKKLSRKELLEMLVIQTRISEQLEKRVKKLEEQLEDKRIKIENAGNLAEAALKLSGVFEAAQAAAEIYLESIKNENKNV